MQTDHDIHMRLVAAISTVCKHLARNVGPDRSAALGQQNVPCRQSPGSAPCQCNLNRVPVYQLCFALCTHQADTEQ